MKRILRRCLLALSSLATFALQPVADRLITSDGRILEVKKARELADGSYQLVFEGAEITCPKRFVASVEIEGDMSDYVPESEDEKKKLAQGYVRCRGKWLSKSAYEAELARAAGLSKARTLEQDEIDEKSLTGSDDALGEAETHYNLACELEPENEELREARDSFLDLLQKKSSTK